MKMINTAIVRTCLARFDSMDVGGIVFRELSNSSVFFSCCPKIFPTPLKDVLHPFLYHIHIFIIDVAIWLKLQVSVIVLNMPNHLPNTNVPRINKRNRTGTCFNKYQHDRWHSRTVLFLLYWTFLLCIS